MKPLLICSSHTISGVAPGSAIAARHEFKSRAAAMAAAGFEGFCMHLRDYAEQRAKGLSDRDILMILADHGLVLRGLEFLTGWDSAEGAALAETAWAAAQGLGASLLNVGQGAGPVPKDSGQDQARFAALAERAAIEGLSLALEIVPWTKARDIASAKALTKGIPNAGLVIDAWHVFRGKIALHELETLQGAEILDIQINDAKPLPDQDLIYETCHRLLCGEGSFPLADFLRALAKTGTKAALSVEIISPKLQRAEVFQAASLAMTAVEALRNLLAGRD